MFPNEKLSPEQHDKSKKAHPKADPNLLRKAIIPVRHGDLPGITDGKMKKAGGRNDCAGMRGEAEATPMSQNGILEEAEPKRRNDHQAAEANRGGPRQTALSTPGIRVKSR